MYICGLMGHIFVYLKKLQFAAYGQSVLVSRESCRKRRTRELSRPVQANNLDTNNYNSLTKIKKY